MRCRFYLQLSLVTFHNTVARWHPHLICSIVESAGTINTFWLVRPHGKKWTKLVSALTRVFYQKSANCIGCILSLLPSKLWTAKGRVVEEHVSVGLGEPFHRLNCNLRATYLLILVSMILRAKNLSCQHCTLSCVRWIWKKLNGLGQIFFHRRIELQFLKNHEYLVALFVTENYHYQFYNLLQNNKLTHALPHRQFWRC